MRVITISFTYIFKFDNIHAVIYEVGGEKEGWIIKSLNKNKLCLLNDKNLKFGTCFKFERESRALSHLAVTPNFSI